MTYTLTNPPIEERKRELWLQHAVGFIVLLLSICSCKKIDKKIFIGTYQRDKFVPADSSKEIFCKIDKSDSWTISLREKDVFQYQGTDTTINGKWIVEEGNYIAFQVDNKTAEGRIDGTIIYFDKPNGLFDNVFDYVLFVKATTKTE
ncbi:MAG: hypothetical protein V4722_16290 [Bacteroidota bacterium]